MVQADIGQEIRRYYPVVVMGEAVMTAARKVMSVAFMYIISLAPTEGIDTCSAVNHVRRDFIAVMVRRRKDARRTVIMMIC